MEKLSDVLLLVNNLEEIENESTCSIAIRDNGNTENGDFWDDFWTILLITLAVIVLIVVVVLVVIYAGAIAAAISSIYASVVSFASMIVSSVSSAVVIAWGTASNFVVRYGGIIANRAVVMSRSGFTLLKSTFNSTYVPLSFQTSKQLYIRGLDYIYSKPIAQVVPSSIVNFSYGGLAIKAGTAGIFGAAATKMYYSSYEELLEDIEDERPIEFLSDAALNLIGELLPEIPGVEGLDFTEPLDELIELD